MVISETMFKERPISANQLAFLKEFCEWKGIEEPNFSSGAELSLWLAQHGTNEYYRWKSHQKQKAQGQRTFRAVKALHEQGLSNEEICERLGIAKSTCVRHLRKLVKD